MCDCLGGEEYEDLPETAGPVIHALAGSIAGICEHTVMFPVDTVKTRLHRLQPGAAAAYRGTVDALRTIARIESPQALFRGISVVAIGAGPAHAIYFSSYEQAKKMLNISDTAADNPMATAAAGVVATMCHEATMNPIEVIKQRMQMHGSVYRSPLHCANEVLLAEGGLAFYRSFPNQMLMSIPFQCTHLVVYEQLRKKLNPTQEYNPLAHLLSGGGAGAIAGAITNPFDVTKTLLNTQEPVFEKQRMSTMWSAVKTIKAESGWAGFSKGMSARMMISAPGTAISWLVYEFFKHTLTPRTTTHNCVD
eukprot:m.194836 g.194836  ORF g.194836 m.194836 type:complete len:307 (-) comp25024_c0_seq1:1180-2100(-)